MVGRPRHQSRHPQQTQQEAAVQLQQESLQGKTSHRERLLPAERLPADCHALRQARTKLPRIHLPRRSSRLVDFMSLDPSLIKNVSATISGAREDLVDDSDMETVSAMFRPFSIEIGGDGLNAHRAVHFVATKIKLVNEQNDDGF